MSLLFYCEIKLKLGKELHKNCYTYIEVWDSMAEGRDLETVRSGEDLRKEYVPCVWVWKILNTK
jgi:hypothetical protein